jgi:hypothetical protein
MELKFFAEDWKPLGNKSSLARTLAKITMVAEEALVEGLQVYGVLGTH